jgi:cyclase
MRRFTHFAVMTAAASAWLIAAAPIRAQEPVWDANKVVLKSVSLADGVTYMLPSDADDKAPRGLPIATTSGIVTGSRGTLVIDTMLNERLARQVLAQATKQGGKAAPRYVVNTSYHGDHSYGNMYFPKSTVIIQHEATKAYIGSHFAEDVKFMLANFGKGRGIEQIRPRGGDVLVSRGGTLALDLGGRTVEIRDFGFAQTGGDLWVWVPDAKVLFAGNPVIAEKPALPWLLDGRVQESLDTLIKVRDFLPAGSRIVPGHGRVMPREGLNWPIAYLEALRDQVKAAIAQGATLEQTAAQVQLPEYQGYALRGWVHNQVNIGAAYREFTK